MKLCILYHPESESARQLDELITELKNTDNKHKIEVISLETREGANLATLYDTLDYPALMVVRDDGQIYKSWEGPDLPLIEDIIYHLNS